MISLVYQDPDGQLLEYRRNPYDARVLHVEARSLKPDGSAYDDSWYPISERRRIWLQEIGSGVLEALGDLVPVEELH